MSKGTAGIGVGIRVHLGENSMGIPMLENNGGYKEKLCRGRKAYMGRGDRASRYGKACEQWVYERAREGG